MKTRFFLVTRIGMFAFILFIFFSANSFSQGKGFGSKGIKSGTGTTHGVNWVDANGDGICDNFVDANGDGINDNPKGFRGGKGNGQGSANCVGKFGSKSGVCDGTGKGRNNAQQNSNSMQKTK
jgi:hypothetical protein